MSKIGVKCTIFGSLAFWNFTMEHPVNHPVCFKLACLGSNIVPQIVSMRRPYFSVNLFSSFSLNMNMKTILRMSSWLKSTTVLSFSVANSIFKKMLATLAPCPLYFFILFYYVPFAHKEIFFTSCKTASAQSSFCLGK